MNQEIIIKLSMLESKTKEVEERIKLIDQNIAELQNIGLALERFDKDETKEVLSQIGKGIFISGEIKGKELIVDVGSKILVKKNPPEVRKIIDEQLVRLSEAKAESFKALELLGHEMEKLIEKVKKESG